MTKNFDHHSQQRGETTFGTDTDSYVFDPTSTIHPIHGISHALQQDLYDKPYEDKAKGEELGAG